MACQCAGCVCVCVERRPWLYTELRAQRRHVSGEGRTAALQRGRPRPRRGTLQGAATRPAAQAAEASPGVTVSQLDGLQETGRRRQCWRRLRRSTQLDSHCVTTVLTLSPPIPSMLYALSYWSNPPFLIFDISVALNPSNSSNLEQLALKGLTALADDFHPNVTTLRSRLCYRKYVCRL